MNKENWKSYQKSFLMGIFFAMGIITSTIVAVTVSATFTSGDTLTAANMNVLKTAIESIPDWTKSGSDAVLSGGGLAVNTGTMVTNSKLTVNGRVSSTTLGTYCGITGTNTTGNIGGYPAAKTACETACSNLNAHMCTNHEISISRQLGISMDVDAYYSSSTHGPGMISGEFNDCNAWTSSVSTSSAMRLGSSGAGVTTHSTCDNSVRIACCL